jgi:prepilin-type N-terminal cleavage/methylation domain-containing protein
MGIRKNTESGFTVVELLITIAISGIIIPSLSIALTNLAVINNRSRDLALVNMLAQNKMELLRSAGYNSVSTGTTDFSSELPSLLTSPKTANYVVSSPVNGTKDVTITITYKEYKISRTVTYKSSISELGVGQ